MAHSAPSVQSTSLISTLSHWVAWRAGKRGAIEHSHLLFELFCDVLSRMIQCHYDLGDLRSASAHLLIRRLLFLRIVRFQAGKDRHISFFQERFKMMSSAPLLHHGMVVQIIHHRCVHHWVVHYRWESTDRLVVLGLHEPRSIWPLITHIWFVALAFLKLVYYSWAAKVVKFLHSCPWLSCSSRFRCATRRAGCRFCCNTIDHDDLWLFILLLYFSTNLSY